MKQTPILKPLIVSLLRIVPVSLAAFAHLSAQSPPGIDGLKVWLDASSPTGLKDGGTVNSWSDLAVAMIPGDAAQNAAIANGGVEEMELPEDVVKGMSRLFAIIEIKPRP